MIHKDDPQEAYAILGMEWVDLPVHVGPGILEESADVFESSVALSLITGLVSVLNKLGEIAISLLGQGTADHISTFVHVGHAIEKALNASEALAES